MTSCEFHIILFNYDLCFDFPPTGYPEATIKSRLVNEFKALKAVDAVKGIPKAFGIVNDDPYRSIIMEYVGDSMKSHTLRDLMEGRCDDDDQMPNHQMLKVTLPLMSNDVYLYLLIKPVSLESKK